MNDLNFHNELRNLLLSQQNSSVTNKDNEIKDEIKVTIKSNSSNKKTPHLALTHRELQGGAANGRNESLLMKSVEEALPTINYILKSKVFIEHMTNHLISNPELIEDLLEFLPLINEENK